jgi:hypothetical protein
MLFIHQVHLPAGVKSGTQEISSAFLEVLYALRTRTQKYAYKNLSNPCLTQVERQSEHDIKEKNHYQNGGIILVFLNSNKT